MAVRLMVTRNIDKYLPRIIIRLGFSYEKDVISFTFSNIVEIDTLAMPLRLRTLRSSSGESFWFAWTSGTTKYKEIATIKPNVPTDRNGRGNPPRLYKAEPNAGPT